jgi:hypothetical protein
MSGPIKESARILRGELRVSRASGVLVTCDGGYFPADCGREVRNLFLARKESC